MQVPIQNRRDRASRWVSKNPTLRDGEIGVERDTGRFKLGDGSTPWNDLKYFEPIGDSIELQNHVLDPSPHPAYDEGPSLILLYENAKV